MPEAQRAGVGTGDSASATSSYGLRGALTHALDPHARLQESLDREVAGVLRVLLVASATILPITLVFDLGSGAGAARSVLAVDLLGIVTAWGMLAASRAGLLTPRRATAASVVLAFALLLTTLVTIVSTRSLAYSSHMILEILGVACVVLSPRAFVGFAITAAGLWLLVAASLHNAELPVHALGIFMTVIVGALLVLHRRRTAEEAIEARYEAERRRVESAAALDRAQQELDKRQAVESERAAIWEQLLQAQKMEAVGTLAAGVAHDMNNILAAITTMAELVRGEAQGEVRDDVVEILNASQRGVDLTRNLLAFSRRAGVRTERSAVKALFDELVRLIGRTLVRRVSIVQDADSADLVVAGDRGQLVHALVNLCLNANDAMPQGGTITLRARPRSLDAQEGHAVGVVPGEYVMVEVIDTGNGMTPEQREQAFKPFFTTKGAGKGTGLGLPMVLETARAHGGAAVIESEPGVGTTVRLVLPRVETAPPAETRRTPLPVGQRSSILLVEDEPQLRRAMRRLLSGMGYDVTEAEHGQAAVERYTGPGCFDLVLLDMSMPVMGGKQCFSRLREIDPNVRVLVLTGYAHDGEADEVLAHGALGLLEKPCERGLLQRSILQALDPLRSDGAAKPS